LSAFLYQSKNRPGPISEQAIEKMTAMKHKHL
jgi:hypothetical protein